MSATDSRLSVGRCDLQIPGLQEVEVSLQPGLDERISNAVEFGAHPGLVFCQCYTYATGRAVEIDFKFFGLSTLCEALPSDFLSNNHRVKFHPKRHLSLRASQN